MFVEPFDAAITRLVAITTEVPGVSQAAAGYPPEVALEAADDLAVLNRVTVDEFGWVRRSGLGRLLLSEHASTCR